MNREDIIRMAREAGFHAWYTQPEEHPDHVAIIERFAALVAKHTLANIDPSSFMSWQEGFAAGAAAEREAMVALAAKQGWAMKNEDPFEGAVREIAAIRARGQA